MRGGGEGRGGEWRGGGRRRGRPVLGVISSSWQGRGRRTFHLRPDQRKNVVSTQGRPKKALAFREMLFQWFVDIKSAVKTRIYVKFVRANARRLLAEFVRAFLDAGMPVPQTPMITSSWLRRWKLEYGVSFRSPNKRYKVSYRGLLFRLEIEWSNNVCIRHFARRMLGRDPGNHLDNADQKGWYMNQAGSKNTPTLAFRGEEAVELKENHAHTRARVSFMTYCSNDPARIARGLPVEICFRLDGPGTTVLPQLVLPRGPYSVRCSDSGSYREEHVYAYLELALEPATEERRAARDWRLFYLDIYAGHLSYRLWALCWSRMYVLLYHGGGCTGLMQANDVWLHATLEQVLGDIEGLEYTRQALLRPGRVPTMSRQFLVNNFFGCWASDIDHRRSIEWTKRVGLSIALDGSEDRGRAGVSSGRAARW